MPRSRAARLLLLWVVPLVVVAAALVWYRLQMRWASTDNAYVKADKVIVSPEVDGYVAAVMVAENERVAVGQPLLRLDEAALRIALEGARARLGAARTQIASLRAQHAEKRAEFDVARRDLDFARREALRQQELAKRKLVSIARADEAARALALAQGRITVLERDIAQIAASLGEALLGDADAHGEVQTALAEVAQRELDLERATLLAPRDGIVSRLPQAGDRLRAGSPALAIVAERGMWVEANFKETDLGKIYAGQSVEIEIDAYGGRTWHGSVQSIAQATGAEFSILPPQNASGNWVKVVQRVPVRISVETAADDPPLRAGMSAYVRVDTSASGDAATSGAGRQARAAP